MKTLLTYVIVVLSVVANFLTVWPRSAAEQVKHVVEQKL